MKLFTHSLPLLLGARLLAADAPSTDLYSVRDFGAKGDGIADDTAAFQKALDKAGQAGGGVVYAPRGNYFFAGHLNVAQNSLDGKFSKQFNPSTWNPPPLNRNTQKRRELGHRISLKRELGGHFIHWLDSKRN